MTPTAKKLLIVLGVLSLIGIIGAVVTRDSDEPRGTRGVAAQR